MSAVRATVVGTGGFIGARLAAHLEERGHDVRRVGRSAVSELCTEERQLGHVFWCAGLTGDFREKAWDTLRAHVHHPADVLERGRYESFTYLSSTRVYAGAASTDEGAALEVRPDRAGDLYNISKLAGEVACFAVERSTVRVVRLANVYGPGASPSFLRSLLASAVTQQHIVLESSRDGERDFVAIDDVVVALEHVALRGAARIYNVASGRNVTNGDVVDAIAAATGARVDVKVPSPSPRSHHRTRATAPEIKVERLRAELAWHPRKLLDDIGALVAAARAELTR